MASASRLAVLLSLCLAALLGLTSCNKIRLGYEYADWLVIYSVEDNFDLDKPQRARLKEDVAGYFRWHRGQMLPKYSDLLLRMADSLKVGLRLDIVDSGYFLYHDLYRKTMEPVVEPALRLLCSLDSAQIEAWYERQKKKNVKLRRDFSGAKDENLERRYQKTLDELEDWTGRLSQDQKSKLRSLSRALPWNGELWIENREILQGKLVALLRRKAPPEELRKFLQGYFLHPEQIRSEAYNAGYHAYEMQAREMIVRVNGILTPDQRKHFVGEVEKLAQNFRTMSKSE